MSEFISTCPKCRQQILCDTAYIGQRVACPICLQQITMPEPSQQVPQLGANLPPGTPQTSSAAGQGKRKLPILAVVIGAVILIAGAGATVFFLHKNSNSSGAPSSPTQASADPLDQCRALWTCDQGNGGTTVNDTSGHGNTATLVGNDVAWVKPGKTGSTALSLGGSSYAETPGPVIDTARSFTVAAWVAITVVNKGLNQTMVSIDGSQIGAFFLMLQPGKDGAHFNFTRRANDIPSADRAWTASPFPVTLNTWYHVAGVYNTEDKSLTLYVNGDLQSTTTFETPWHASGKTAIGRGYFEGKNKDFFCGELCDIRLYDRALTAAQIKALASR